MAGNIKSMNNDVLCVKNLRSGIVEWAKKGTGCKKDYCNLTSKFRRKFLIETYGEDVDSRYNQLRFADKVSGYSYTEEDKLFIQRYESSVFAVDDKGCQIIDILKNGCVVKSLSYSSGSVARELCKDDIPFDCTRLQSDARTGLDRKIDKDIWQVVFHKE